MLARIRKSMEDKDQGFTLIELLVVMIIIGILAAIAIPVFLNQRKKARDTAAKADVTTIGKEMAAYYVDGKGALTNNGSVAGTWKFKSDDTTAYLAQGNLSAGNLVGQIVGTYASPNPTYCASVKTSDGNYWVFDSAQNPSLFQGAVDSCG